MRFIYIDTETALTRRSLMAPPLACLTWAERHGSEIKNGIMGAHDATRWMHQVLDDDGVYLGGHFVQFDTVTLAQADNTLLPKLFRAYRRGRILCTDLRQRLLDLGRDSYILKRNQQRSGSYTLDTLVKKHFGHQLDKSTWRLRYGQLIHVPVRDWPEGAIRYALDDVGWGLMLYEKQGELAIKHGFQGPRPMSVLDDDAQARSGFALQLMRAWGMRTDVDQVAATKERYERSYTMARQQLMSTKVNGKTILRPDGSQDMKFTKQLIAQAWVNGGRKLADILLTEKGEEMKEEGRLTVENIVDVVQTGKDMLDIVGDDPVLAPLKGFKNIQKTLKTFIPVVERGAYEPICPYFNTLVTNGRSSCSDPNLQNLPRGGGVRECFIPRKGKVFVNADYDSLEARTFAEVLYIMGFGTTLLNSYLQNPDFDPHARLGSQMLNISEAEGLQRKDSADKTVKKAFKEVRQRAKCFHPDTEVLCLEEGWKKISQLSGEEEIAVAEPLDDGKACSVDIRWEKPLRLTWRESPGELVHLKNEGIDLRVTPDHKMLGFKQKTYKPYECLPEELNNARYWSNAGVVADTCDVDVETERICRIAVAVQADGSYNKGGGIRLGFTKQRKVNRLRKLLKEDEYRFELVGAAQTKTFYLTPEFSSVVKSWLGPEKNFHWGWLKLPLRLRKAAIDEAAFWDSHLSVRPSTGSYRYSNTQEVSVDVLQAMASISGQKTAKYKHTRPHESHKDYCNLTVRGKVSKSRGGNLSTMRVPYEGKVFCLTTSTGCVLVRDGGIPVITKQCANFGYPGGMGAATFIDYAKAYGLSLSIAEAKELKTHWLKSVPEAKKYFRWVSQQTGGGKARIQQLLSGRWRGGLGYTDLANTKWSGLAADGVKEATFDVQEACYAIPTSPLYGTRCVAVIHDELIAECEPEGGHEIGHELSRLMVEAMQRYTRHTPSRASPQLMYRWYKDAEPTYDKHGRLVPWEPSA